MVVRIKEQQLNTTTKFLKKNKMECKCCKREEDLRLGFCFDCVEAESIIADGVDMYDNEILKVKGLSTPMSKVQYILNLYGVITKSE